MFNNNLKVSSPLPIELKSAKTNASLSSLSIVPELTSKCMFSCCSLLTGLILKLFFYVEWSSDECCR